MISRQTPTILPALPTTLQTSTLAAYQDLLLQSHKDFEKCMLISNSQFTLSHVHKLQYFIMSDPSVKVPLGHSVRLLHYLTGHVVFANGSDYGLSPPSRAQSQRWITGSERSGNGFRYSIESQSVQGRVRLAVNPDTYWHFLEPQWIWASQYR